MITIVLVAPYADIKEDMEQALEEYQPPEPIQASVHVMGSDEVRETAFQADVVIARGFSASALKRRHPGQLVVPLQISAYDVIEAIADAIDTFHARSIGLVGLPDAVAMAERIGRLFRAEVRSYQARDVSDLRARVDEAERDGCDALVGGLSLTSLCRELGKNAVLLRTSKAAVAGSVEEAIRLVRSTREQRDISLSLAAVLDHTREGVLSLNHNRCITSINRLARSYLDLPGGDECLGKRITEVLPFSVDGLGAVFQEGKRVENELHTFGGRMLAVDCIPLRRDRRNNGCVVFLRSVDKLQDEESLIRRKIQAMGQKARYRFEDIVAESAVSRRCIEKAARYAQVDSPVLIAGESGTGKELYAQGIHNASLRRDGPFIAVNCAALSETLLESELFGYSDGAFTGALRGGREGLFEAAHGGTLFLDEISEIPVPFQSKLLRVLQENEVRRLGSQRVVSIDVRIIAATNRDLTRLVAEKQFRQDLLFRLNVLHMHIEPLRRRPEDIMELFRIYTSEYGAKYGAKPGMVKPGAGQMLLRHRWSGNVRELKNIAERLCVLNRGEVIDAAMLADAMREGAFQEPVDEAKSGYGLPESERLRQLLNRFDGNRGKVAMALGVDRSTLWRKMKKHGLL